jgi:hypothetical protein
MLRSLARAALFLLALSLAPAVAHADEVTTGCQGDGCTCGSGEGGHCPLHRPGSKRRPTVNAPVFDANSIVTMHGTVTRVERETHAPGRVEVHLEVRVGRQTLTVRLGPADFVDPLVTFAEADAVQFTGSSVLVNGRPNVLATVITRGGKTVRLRQDDGTPLFRLSE